MVPIKEIPPRSRSQALTFRGARSRASSPATAVPTNVRLLEPPVASPKGTVYLRYGLADGTPETGDMGAPDRRAGEA